MTVKNIILLMMVSLILTGSAIATENYYAYNESQFGNVHIQASVSGGDTIGGANNVTICIPTTAPKSGYISSFITSGIWDYAMEYCIDTGIGLPSTECDTTVSGVMGFGYESVSNYLNYKFTLGEDIYFCFQEPTAIGTNSIDAWNTNVNEIPNGNNSWHSFSSSDPNDLKQYKLSYSNNFTTGSPNYYPVGYWLYTISGGWTLRTKLPEEFQFCMKEFAGDSEECYNLGSKAYNRFLQCGGANQKTGEQFRWYGENNVEINRINLWLYANTGLTSTAKFRIGVDEFDPDTNISTNLWLGNLHNYSEINISGSIGYRYVTEEIPFTNITLQNGEYYRVYYVCTAGCGSGTFTICSALTREESADNYSFAGFQGTTGQLFIETVPTFYANYTDMAFLMTSGSGDIWQPESDEIGNCSTTCTTYSTPYYLREDFNGIISDCGWVVNILECFDGKLLRLKTDPYYTIFKLTDLVEESKTRYYTVSFEIQPADIDPTGYLSIGLYDYDYVRYVNMLFSESGTLYNNEQGNAVLRYSNISTGSSKTFQIHVDLVSDNFDVYYDGIKILSDLQFTNSLYNMDSLYGIRISSINAGFEIENLSIYASTQDNQIIIPDEEFVPVVDETKSWCDLFTNDKIACSSDSECDTGDCLPNGYCNGFDMTTCDDNGKKRRAYYINFQR